MLRRKSSKGGNVLGEKKAGCLEGQEGESGRGRKPGKCVRRSKAGLTARRAIMDVVM